MSGAILSRRRIVFAGMAAWLVVREAEAALPAGVVDPSASTDDLTSVVKRFAGDQPLRTGRVKLDIAPLVENGNAVPITVAVDSPMTAADHVTAIAVYNEKNPQRDVIVCRLGPRAGRAELATRIRLATSQKLVALARMSDGSCWQASVDVVVTLAACIES